MQVVVLPGSAAGQAGCAASGSSLVLSDQLIEMGRSRSWLSLVSLAVIAIMEPKLKHWNQRIQVGETGVPQAHLMDARSVGAHHVLKGGALLADLQLAVAVGRLKSRCRSMSSSLTCLVIEAELLAPRMRDAARGAGANQRCAAIRAARFSGRDELQR